MTCSSKCITPIECNVKTNIIALVGSCIQFSLQRYV